MASVVSRETSTFERRKMIKLNRKFGFEKYRPYQPIQATPPRATSAAPSPIMYSEQAIKLVHTSPHYSSGHDGSTTCELSCDTCSRDILDAHLAVVVWLPHRLDFQYSVNRPHCPHRTKLGCRSCTTLIRTLDEGVQTSCGLCTGIVRGMPTKVAEGIYIEPSSRHLPVIHSDVQKPIHTHM